jgi:hypothetical protein
MMGRCRVTREESSFSRCSGVKFAKEARVGALMAEEMLETNAGVKVLENRRCKADIIWILFIDAKA